MKHANPATPRQTIIKQTLTNICKLTLGVQFGSLIFKMVN